MTLPHAVTLEKPEAPSPVEARPPKPAGFGLRLGAALIDLILGSVLMVIGGVAGFFAGSSLDLQALGALPPEQQQQALQGIGSDPDAALAMVQGMILVLAVYALVPPLLTAAGTLGKACLGLWVGTRAGTALPIPRRMLRLLFPLIAILGVHGSILAGRDPDLGWLQLIALGLGVVGLVLMVLDILLLPVLPGRRSLSDRLADAGVFRQVLAGHEFLLPPGSEQPPAPPPRPEP